MVAVAVAGVERDDDIGTDVVDDGPQLGCDSARFGGHKHVRLGVSCRTGVDVVEKMHRSDAENSCRRPQLHLP